MKKKTEHHAPIEGIKYRSTEIIAEFRQGTTIALLERVDGNQFRITFVKRYNDRVRAENAFLSFIPPSRIDEYRSIIADSKFTNRSKIS